MTDERAAGIRPRHARLLQRVVFVREDEISALLLACAYFFFLLSSWYILRPIRDEMGVAGGVQNLAWLFTGTLVATLVANPLFSLLVARLPPRRFITIAYRFFISNLLLFFLLLKLMPDDFDIVLGRIFFVWTSVFNLFVVSVFWGLMADAFRDEQGKRLFGFIGAGGTLGGILGGALTATVVGSIGVVNLLIISALLLELAVQCARRFPLFTEVRDVHGRASKRLTVRLAGGDNGVIGGGVLDGIKHVASSPYLLGICAFMLLFTIGSTFLYFQQSTIISSTLADPKARTALFARVDVAVNVLTLLTQLFLTGRLMKWLGVGTVLALLPAWSVIGFFGLSIAPVLGVVVVVQVLRRAANFALSGPAREVLFTVLPREDKYKAKNFIDTFVYRGGDQIGAWANDLLLKSFNMTAAGVAFIAIPLSAVWLIIALWLGRRQKALARCEDGN